MANEADYTKHVTDEENERVLNNHQDDLAEENRKMKALNDKNIADMQRVSEQRRQEQEDVDEQKLSDRVVRQQRSESKRILPNAKEQIPSASRQVDKAEEQVANTSMQITQAKLAKYADKVQTNKQNTMKQARQKQRNAQMLRRGLGVAGTTALASVFKRQHNKKTQAPKDEVKEQRSVIDTKDETTPVVETLQDAKKQKTNVLPKSHEAKHLMSPVNEYEQLKQDQDDKLNFISQARALRNEEKKADPQSVAGIRKKMRMLAATELYPNTTSKTLTKKQLATLNGDAGTVLSKARNHADHELHQISERMRVLEPLLPKTKIQDAVTTKPETDTTKPEKATKQTETPKATTVSNKQLGIGDTAIGTATASKGAPIDANVEKAGMEDKQLDLDDKMHETAGKTAENVDERVAKLEAQLADAQAENMQLRKQQEKRNKTSFINKWKENQAKYDKMSTKSLVAATATRLGKATLKVSAKVIAASLTVVAAAGYMGARKADKMAKKIKSNMDSSVMRGVDPSLANQVDLGK
jgi:hypothetical protein